MSTQSKTRLLTGAMALALLLAACGSPAPAAPTSAPAAPAATEAPKPTDAPAPTEAPKPTEAPAAMEAKDIVTWYQYDQKNEDTKADEAVGNAYLRTTIPKFDKTFEGKYRWVNQPQQWSKMTTALVSAVQAGGDVPDLMHMGSGSLPVLVKNGTVQDLTDWAKSQAWFADLDPAAVKACTGKDGKLYCIPVATTPALVFYWKDHFPNGYPKTADDFLRQAAELKAKNVFAITYFGSTAFDGEASGRYFWATISSFGGSYDDGNGNLKLNAPANIKAVEFMREVVAKGYSSDSVWLGDFKEEEDLKGLDAAKPVAASFPTGIFGYRYIQPVKAPNGKQYGKDFDPTGGPMLEAIAAGDMGVAPMFAGGDAKESSCGIGASAFVIPAGAKNVEGAQAYINWVMDPANGIEWVQKPGGGFPANKTFLADKAFDTPFYKQAAAATTGRCKSPVGSLERTQEAWKIIANAIFDLIKKDPTADIAARLEQADKEYNAGN